MLRDRSLPEKTSFTEQDASTNSNFTDDEKSDLKHQSDISLSTYGASRVTLSHATIAAGKDGKALLSDCNISFGINSVSMVVGPVGAVRCFISRFASRYKPVFVNLGKIDPPQNSSWGDLLHRWREH